MREIPDNRKLGSIINNDDNLLTVLQGDDMTPKNYNRAVLRLLETRPTVLAQLVGLPDPVIYRSRAATGWDKYLGEVMKAVTGKDDGRSDALKRLFDTGTDPLALTVEACREQDVLIMASFRMNEKCWCAGQLDSYDFGRQNKHLKIPAENCLDPIHPEVGSHRMVIFEEVTNEYDIDGLELDYMRRGIMISDPHKNHGILTQMVADTRKMLDEVARQKGRKRLLLGVRVGYALSGPPHSQEVSALSCHDLGVDVKTWIKKGYVDYVCPSLFWPYWPGLPKTKEFVELAKGTKVGIYPTLFPIPEWIHAGKDYTGPLLPNQSERMLKYKNEFCRLALRIYEGGADGISTYNWVPHHQPDIVSGTFRKNWGLAAFEIQKIMGTKLGNPQAIKDYLDQEDPLKGD